MIVIAKGRAPEFHALIQFADERFGAANLVADLIVCQMGRQLVGISMNTDKMTVARHAFENGVIRGRPQAFS